jgi:hypothetical protein
MIETVAKPATFIRAARFKMPAGYLEPIERGDNRALALQYGRRHPTKILNRYFMACATGNSAISLN